MAESSLALNGSQKEAVNFSGRRLLVVAGPGTGKTRTLTSRIAFLIEKRGVDPRSIVALTFTNRAADEMGARLTDSLGRARSESIFIGTFHALGFEILRREWRSLGFGRSPVIYDEDDKRDLVAQLFARTGQRALRSTVESAIESLAPIGGDAVDRSLAQLYEEAKRAESAVDFDDLVALPLDLLRRDREGRAFYQARWRHLFVDEYQDVNADQVALIKLLEAEAESFMAIGDPDQAIYSFRGSDVKHFDRFTEDFPESRVLHLRDNYRSTVTIVNASDQIIGRNRRSAACAPPSRPHNAQGLRVQIDSVPSDKAEARLVVRTIENLVGGVGRFGLDDVRSEEECDDEYGFSDIAVLYRLNAQAATLCAALDEAGIPYQRVGTGRKRADRLERAILALARLSLRGASLDEEGAARRRIGALKVDVEEVAAAFRSRIAKEKTRRIPHAAPLLHAAGKVLAAALPARTEELVALSGRLVERAALSDASRLDFLPAAPLVNSEDPWAARAEKITLSTIHAAKGLEFPVVFVTGLEEGLIPFVGDDEPDRAAALEEERRLLYVGMTRAKNRLHLTAARRRFLFGQNLAAARSPYLSEISDDLVRFVRARRGQRKENPPESGSSQMGLFD